ncbi:MAG: 30S ribosome-binding factor RbfA [Leptospirillum sp.]|jgi:ribosome-binding factor A
MKQDGMKQGFRRADRVAKEIKEIVAILFSRYASETNLSFVTITNVSLSDDLKSARIFYTIFPGVDNKLVAEAIDRSQGWVRRELSRQIKIKSVPKIQFFPQDDSGEFLEASNLIDS